MKLQGGNIGKWFKHESVVKDILPREFFTANPDLLIPVCEQIDINAPGTEFLLSACASQIIFDAVEEGDQLPRRLSAFKTGDQVVEVRPAKTLGIRFIDRRDLRIAKMFDEQAHGHAEMALSLLVAAQA